MTYMDAFFVDLPWDIIENHIFTKLPIDTRLAMGIKPNKLSENTIKTMTKLYRRVLRNRPRILYFSSFSDGSLRCMELTCRVGNNVYLYRSNVLSRNRLLSIDEVDYNNHLFDMWTRDRGVTTFTENE
jgi:hypothetical protein